MREVGGSSPSSPTAESPPLPCFLVPATGPRHGIGPTPNLCHGLPHGRIFFEGRPVLPVECHRSVGQQGGGIFQNLVRAHLMAASPLLARRVFLATGTVPPVYHIQAKGHAESQGVRLGEFTIPKFLDITVPPGIRVLSPGPAHPLPLIVHLGRGSAY